MMIRTQAPKTITERRSLESSDFGDLCESGMERVCAIVRSGSMARFGHGMARESDYRSNNACALRRRERRFSRKLRARG
jgi:hypothetical protein